MLCVFLFFKQKTAYEMRISDWSSDVCSSDLARREEHDWTLRAGGAGAVRTLRGGDRRLADRGLSRRAAGGAQRRGGGPDAGAEIGRASCRERVCQYV